MKKDSLMFTLGIFCLTSWIFDIVNMLFYIHKPEYMLWYSSAGLFLTGLALLLQNPRILSSLFCALFVIESMWSFDFLTRIFFNHNVLGITNYIFANTYTKKDFFMTLYHLYIPPILFIGLIQTKKVFRFSWIASIGYVVVLLFLTIIFSRRAEGVNCIYSLKECSGAFRSLITMSPFPYRIFLGIIGLSLAIYLPTNYLLLIAGRRFKWTVL